ncbi:MAG: HPr family phosphocarrier protein [Polyangiales bacterium]
MSGPQTVTVEVTKDDRIADAKSIMGVLLLCGQKGAKLTLRAMGTDADEALAALCALVSGGFGESQ